MLIRVTAVYSHRHAGTPDSMQVAWLEANEVVSVEIAPDDTATCKVSFRHNSVMYVRASLNALAQEINEAKSQ